MGQKIYGTITYKLVMFAGLNHWFTIWIIASEDMVPELDDLRRKSIVSDDEIRPGHVASGKPKGPSCLGL
jgi:hypothetical protein